MERLNKKQIRQTCIQTNIIRVQNNPSVSLQLSIMRLTSNHLQILKYMSVSFSNSSFDPFEKIPRKQDGDVLSFNKTKK